MIFVFFSMFFRCRFSSALRKAKKSSNMSQQDTESENFGPGSDDPLAPGERQREGYKIFALHKEFGFSDSPSVIGQDVSESDFETSLARRWHTCGGRRIETPRGGTPPANHLWRICDRGLVLAGVLGVLGFLGILAKNLEKIVPEPSQIELRGLQNPVRGVQNPARSPPRRYF